MTPLNDGQRANLKRSLNVFRENAYDEAYARADEDLCEHQGVASGKVQLANNGLKVEGTSSTGNCSHYTWKKAKSCHKLTVHKSGIFGSYYINPHLRGGDADLLINKHGEVLEKKSSRTHSHKYFYVDTEDNLILLKYIKSDANSKSGSYTIDNCIAIYRMDVRSAEEAQ